MSLKSARWSPAPVVCETSAWNGLAFTPHQLWACRRAELTAFAETPFVGSNGKRLTMAHLRTLAPKTSGVQRLIEIGKRLLQPLLARLEALPPNARVELYLCLAEYYPEDSDERRQLERALEEEVLARTRRRMAPRTTALGHASFAYALLEAGQALATNALDAVLIGGLETSYDPDTVEALIAQRRIFDGENLDSFIPGEGGAFLLVARPDVARRAGWPALARLEAAATHPEPANLLSGEPCAAIGLSRALRALADFAIKEKRTLDYWIVDVTGESYRAHEWQLAMPRATQGITGEGTTLELLPTLLGDLGAATLPTGAVVAVEAFLRGAPKADTCVLSGSSVGEPRGAVWMSRG